VAVPTPFLAQAWRRIDTDCTRSVDPVLIQSMVPIDESMMQRVKDTRKLEDHSSRARRWKTIRYSTTPWRRRPTRNVRCAWRSPTPPVGLRRCAVSPAAHGAAKPGMQVDGVQQPPVFHSSGSSGLPRISVISAPAGTLGNWRSMPQPFAD